MASRRLDPFARARRSRRPRRPWSTPALVRRVAAVAMAVAMLGAQVAPTVLAAPSPGTSLTATKTTTGHLIKRFSWILAKTASPSSITLSNGETSDPVSYTVTATKDAGTLEAWFDGQVCVTNSGAVATQGLTIKDSLTKPPSKSTLATIDVSVAAKPVLQPGQTYCYPYRIDVPTSAITAGATYKDTTSVNITNKSSGKSGPSPSATAPLPSTPEQTLNGSLAVNDSYANLSWTFSSSGSRSYTRTFTCDADKGVQTNTVTTSGYQPPAGGSAPTASATVTVTCLDPDVTVTKTVDPTSATAGDTVTYTITVENLGPGTAHGVTLIDTFPADLTDLVLGNTTDFELTGDVLTLKDEPLASLAAGGSLSTTVTAKVAESACETTVPNTATVAATNQLPAQEGNDSDGADLDVGCVHLEVTKTADAPSVSAGANIGFAIVVINTGLSTAMGVTLTDTLPSAPGLSWFVGPPVPGCSITLGVLTCDFGDIGPSASAPLVHVVSPTTAETCGPLTNTATASATNDGSASSSPATVTVLCPDVTVTKTADASSISAGETAGFTIVVSNVGAGTASAVTLADPLPGGIDWFDDSAACDIVGGTLICPFSVLGSGASETVHVTGTTDAADCGPLANTATVSATNEAFSAASNNTASATISVLCPSLQVVKTADAPTVSAGEDIGFEITVTNGGDGTAKAVTLTDSFPFTGGLAWSLDGGADDVDCSITPPAAQTNQVLTCTFGDLAPGASRTVRVASGTGPACFVVPNVATADATNSDPVDSAVAQVEILCPDVSVTKTAADDTIEAGETASFTVTVTNDGAGTARDVTLSDTLPAGVDWSEGPDSTDCSITGGVLSCDFGDLAPGASVSVTVSGTTDYADCGVLPNTATASATNENGADLANDSSTATIEVLCAQVAITKTADAGTVQDGAPIGFTITAHNGGGSTAQGVSVTDALPTDTDLSWSIDPANADCTIASGVLTCAFGSLAPGADASVHITSPTTSDTCPDSPVDNTASVTTSNDGSGQASASVVVQCNTAPVADSQSVSTNEDTPKLITLSASDADDDDLTFTIVDPPTHGGVGPVSVADCSAVNTCTASVTYTPDQDYNGPDSFTFKVSDGVDDSNTATVSITVDPVNDPPVVDTSAGSLAYTEGDAPTAIDPGVTVTDVDDTNLESATVTLTTGCQPSQDALALASPPSGISAVYTAATCTLVLSGTASVASYQTALRAVTYVNSSDAPSTTPRTATFTVSDGDATGSDTRSIVVTAVNDAPVNTVPGAQTVNEDQAKVFSSGNGNAISIADPDAGGGSIQVSLDVDHGVLTLSGTSGLAFTVGDGSADATMTFTGSIASINAALAGLSYQPDANWNSTRGSEVLTIVTNDQGNTGTGGALSDTDTVAITVDAVNDAPVAAAKAFTVEANMKIVGLSGLLTGATDPDTGDGGYTATFTVNDIVLNACTNGTISNINTAAGTFDFDPPPGLGTSCTLQYRVNDSGNPGSATSAYANIAITIAGPVIWFVNPAAAVNGDGRLSSPFNTLAAADAVDATGHRTFLYTGTATSGITLNTSEWLIGQGVTGSTFDALFAITPPTGTIARPSINGTRPTVQGNVVMASSDAVRGLNVSPASGIAGLSASSATSLTVGEVSVTTTNATAVGLTNSDGIFSFTAVSATGGPNGIVWNNASPATGSLTVDGDGSNTSLGGNGTGGTIANATGSDGAVAGSGVYLNNARSVTLRRMTVNGTNQNFGIRGTSVTNFTMEYSTVSGANGTSTPSREGSVIFDNLFGSGGIASSIISGAIEDNVRIENTTGTLTAFNLTNSTIQNNNTVSGNIGFRFATATTGVSMTGTVSGTRFQGNRTIAIQADASNGTVDFTASNNTIVAGTGGNNQGNQGIEVDVANNGVMTFSVAGNKIGTDGITNQPLLNTGINIFNGTLASSGTPATITGTVSNNTLYNAGAGQSGFGIRLFNQGYGTMNANVANNTVSNVGLDYGIFAEVSSNSGTANATGSSSIGMTNNTSNVLSGALDAIRLQARGRTTMCARISGNASTTAGTGFFGLEIRQAAQTVNSVTYQATFNLEGLTAGLQTNHATIVSYLANQNPAVTDGVDEIHSAGITGVASNSCSSIP